MARLSSAPRKSQPPDHDFKIHVDDSCLSTPMEGDAALKAFESMPVEDEKGVLPPEETAAEDEVSEQTPTERANEGIATIAEEAEGPNDDEATEPKNQDNGDEPIHGQAQEQAIQDEPLDEGGEADAADPGRAGSKTPPEQLGDKLFEDEDTPRPSQIIDLYNDTENSSRRESSSSEQRKTSLRTEALIQAAARAVVARIEKQDNKSQPQDDGDDNPSILSGRTSESFGPGTELSYDESSDGSRRTSENSHLLPAPSAHSSEPGERGEASSHHEADDDVFSDRSPRSSMGSFEGSTDDTHSKSGDTVQHNEEYGRSPRVSGISHLSQYENENFVPTARGTPRPAFRTPSAVRALQMSSPTPSVFGSPRSSKRHTGVSINGLPTVSRLGSPSVSAQYSPKGRSTPPRFKTKKEAPLVLLHVTMLPLRWIWSDVFNGIDNVKGPDDYAPSDQMKTLRDAWRQLQDRVGDTVLERGVLLPHPQNDYEILEERLLEALDLPLRRRARILECGHYLGPANETTLGDDEYAESDDEFASQAGDARSNREKRHWCATCRSEIKYDELGLGKIFRVKVYASNGLMKAGAWDACWKEMERIDAEIEPIVEAGLHKELEKVAAFQLEERHRGEQERRAAFGVDDEDITQQPPMNPSSPPMPTSPVEPHAATTTDVEASRRRRDQERLREIYGHTPPPADPTVIASSMHPHPDSYIPPPTPPSPSEEAYERRETRRRSYQAASLPELLLEAARVVFQDRRNVAIALLSIFVLMLAVRTAPAPSGALDRKEAEILKDLYARHEALEQTETVRMQTAQQDVLVNDAVTSAVSSVVPVRESAGGNTSGEAASIVSDPCESQAHKDKVLPRADEVPARPPSASSVLTGSGETATDRSVVRIYETVTETIRVTETEAASAVYEPAETVVETVRVTLTESVSAAPAAVSGVEDKAFDNAAAA